MPLTRHRRRLEVPQKSKVTRRAIRRDSGLLAVARSLLPGTAIRIRAHRPAVLFDGGRRTREGAGNPLPHREGFVQAEIAKEEQCDQGNAKEKNIRSIVEMSLHGPTSVQSSRVDVNAGRERGPFFYSVVAQRPTTQLWGQRFPKRCLHLAQWRSAASVIWSPRSWLRPVALIQGSMLNRFSQVGDRERIGPSKIGHRSCDLQDPVVCPLRQALLLYGAPAAAPHPASIRNKRESDASSSAHSNRSSLRACGIVPAADHARPARVRESPPIPRPPRSSLYCTAGTSMWMSIRSSSGPEILAT